MKRTFGTDINKIRYQVYVEVAKQLLQISWRKKETKFHIQSFRDGHRPIAAVFTVKEKLSARESVLRKAMLQKRAQRIKISFRYFRRLAKAVRSIVFL